MVLRGFGVAVLVVCGAACSPRPVRSEYFDLGVVRSGRTVDLTLVPRNGAQINARIHPVLELDNGDLVQFSANQVTADSAYFVGRPVARVSVDGDRVEGMLRIGICPPGAGYCESIAVRISESLPWELEH